MRILWSTFTQSYTNLPAPLKASFWFLICNFTQKEISVITTPIFTRLLTPAEFGAYSVFNSWLSIITVIVTLNLSYGVYMQGLVKFDDNRRKFSSSMQGLSLTLVALWAVVYFIFRDFWNVLFSLTTVQVSTMLVIVWTSSVFSFWASEQRVDYKYVKLVVITIFAAIAQPALGVYLVIHAEDKVTARILGIAFVELAIYTWLFFAQMLRGRQFFSWNIWKYALLFNLPLVPHYLSVSILSTVDRIMIEKMVGVAQAGIYSLAFSVSMIMTLFNTSMTQTIGPWLYKKIKARDIGNISCVAYPAFAIIACLNVVLMACAPEVVAIFAPAEYNDAIWIIPPVAMSSYFMFAYTFFANFEFYYEKTWLITIATMTGAVLKLLLNWGFINIFGYYAAGYTTLVCYIVYAAMHYIFMIKICNDYLGGVRAYSTKTLLAITAIFMVIGFTILCTYERPMFRYALIAIFVLILFVKHKYIMTTINNLINIKKNN